MSQRGKNVVISICVLLLIAVVWLDHKFGLKPLLSAEQVKHKDIARYHNNNFRVVKVIDGDTLDIDIPDGKFNSTRIRLLGVDTPETKDDRFGIMYFGPEAAQFTKELIINENITVLLDKRSPTRDKYNRLIAYLKMSDGTILNEALLTKGFAYADLRFEHSFYEEYSQLETAARKNKIGLWKQVEQQQLPDWLRRMKPELLKE